MEHYVDVVRNTALQHYLETYSDRLFKAHFKFSLNQVAYLCQILPNVRVINILHVLFYLKTYPTFDMISQRTGMDSKTFRLVLLETCDYIDQGIPELNYEARFDDWNLVSPSCIADGFDCPILDPRIIPFARRVVYHSHKIGHALRYVVAVHINSGKFVWLSNSYPGATSEIAICRNELFPLLLPNERIMADRLFRFSDRFLTATGTRCALTTWVNTVRSLVERRIGLIKHFRIFTDRFRSPNYDLHCRFVRLCCRLINLLDFID